MLKKNNSRRAFIKKSSLGGLGAAIGASSLTSLFATESAKNTAEKILSIHPRYYRWHVDPGIEWLESNTDYATLNWDIPISQVALVLVDVWSSHYLKDTAERAEYIINKKFVPLLAACRKSGITVIHAPSPAVATIHPNWVKLAKESEIGCNEDNSWPPADFREKKGRYQSYARPAEPREAERLKIAFPHVFHPKVSPVGNEPVIAWGEELHRYCKQKGILFLLYAGFNTNACLITRSYSLLQMNINKGYETVLLRDCTTGMESKYSQATMSQTEGAILFFEMSGQYSITSEEVLASLQS